MDKTNALTAFAALSQDTRLDALKLLVEAGPHGMAAGDIGETLGVRQNTMSANLSILHQAGLVRTVREGRTIRYFADFEALSGLIGFLMNDCCGGRPELCVPAVPSQRCG